MLVLSRKRGESIRIGDQIEVTVIHISPGRISLGIARKCIVAFAPGSLWPRSDFCVIRIRYKTQLVHNSFPTPSLWRN